MKTYNVNILNVRTYFISIFVVVCVNECRCNGKKELLRRLQAVNFRRFLFQSVCIHKSVATLCNLSILMFFFSFIVPYHIHGYLEELFVILFLS